MAEFKCENKKITEDEKRVKIEIESPENFGLFQVKHFDFRYGHYPVRVSEELCPSPVRLFAARVDCPGERLEDGQEKDEIVARLTYKENTMRIEISKKFPDDASRGDPAGTGGRLYKYGVSDKPYERLTRMYDSLFEVAK